MNSKSIFIDLDDTLWDFSANARDTFEEVYLLHRLNSFFESFEQFFTTYQKRNVELWVEYGNGEITKEELNRQRFLYPLQQVGVNDERLAKDYSDDFFARIPYKQKLKPHAKELLEHLSAKYRLYILSNGFRELQLRKMQSSGIDGYFKKVILSEDIGVMKPWPQIFHFALSSTQTELKDALMIGDSWEADMVGARGVGMRQLYYNPQHLTDLSFRPTYEVHDLAEIPKLSLFL